LALEFREGGIADTVLHFKYDKHNKYHRAGRKLLITAISLVMFVEAWWVISIIANSYTIPNPADTWDALVDFYSNGDTMSGGKSMWSYISSSLSTYLEGFILALVVSIPLGLVLGKFATLREFATPMIEVLRPIAPIAWAPIFMVAIDYETGPMLVVFVGIFFPLLTNVIFGVSKIEPNLIDASKTLGALRRPDLREGHDTVHRSLHHERDQGRARHRLDVHRCRGTVRLSSRRHRVLPLRAGDGRLLAFRLRRDRHHRSAGDPHLRARRLHTQVHIEENGGWMSDGLPTTG
jgi:hypothetical protein